MDAAQGHSCENALSMKALPPDGLSIDPHPAWVDFGEQAQNGPKPHSPHHHLSHPPPLAQAIQSMNPFPSGQLLNKIGQTSNNVTPASLTPPPAPAPDYPQTARRRRARNRSPRRAGNSPGPPPAPRYRPSANPHPAPLPARGIRPEYLSGR